MDNLQTLKQVRDLGLQIQALSQDSSIILSAGPNQEGSEAFAELAHLAALLTDKAEFIHKSLGLDF